MTEAEQIEFVKEAWNNIGCIKKPSETVQMAAVNADVWAILCIIKPTLKAKLKLINYHWREIYLFNCSSLSWL